MFELRLAASDGYPSIHTLVALIRERRSGFVRERKTQNGVGLSPVHRYP